MRDQQIPPPRPPRPTQAFLNFVKSMFGCGVLSLPHAFEQSGLWAGIATFLAIGGLCTYTMVLIVRCKHMVAKAQPASSKPLVTYGDVASGSS